jgi:hypothetical protein
MDARTPGEVLSAACGTIPALERCLALTDAIGHVLSLCSFKTADARAISGKGKHRGRCSTTLRYGSESWLSQDTNRGYCLINSLKLEGLYRRIGRISSGHLLVFLKHAK